MSRWLQPTARSQIRACERGKSDDNTCVSWRLQLMGKGWLTPGAGCLQNNNCSRIIYQGIRGFHRV
jgi:hypothetical protein